MSGIQKTMWLHAFSHIRSSRRAITSLVFYNNNLLTQTDICSVRLLVQINILFLCNWQDRVSIVFDKKCYKKGRWKQTSHVLFKARALHISRIVKFFSKMAKQHVVFALLMLALLTMDACRGFSVGMLNSVRRGSPTTKKMVQVIILTRKIKICKWK